MRYLIRGAVDPLDNPSQTKYVLDNYAGTNTGNMLFTNSILRCILVDDNTTYDFVETNKNKLNKEYADFVNENYDCFLIPLANAFKKNFIKEMQKLTAFIKMLTIPCVVIGIGIQQQRDVSDFYEAFPYNDDARNFVSAVIEKSGKIGVRGALTAEYMSKLGFKEDSDFTIIGCPSLYTFGDNLPQLKSCEIGSDSVIALNSKNDFEVMKRYKPYLDFAKRTMDSFKNSIYIQQHIDDIQMIYLDSLRDELREQKFYPIEKCVAFSNVSTWLEYMRDNVDLSIGTRIHGNIASLLAGTPAIILPYDKRVLELCDYHELPVFPYENLNKNVSVYDMLEKVDFSKMYKNHAQRFEHYHAFLNEVGIDNVFNYEYENSITPFDRIQSATNYSPVIMPYSLISEEERLKRYKEAFLFSLEKDERRVIRINELKDKQEELKAQMNASIMYRIERKIKRTIKK